MPREADSDSRNSSESPMTLTSERRRAFAGWSESAMRRAIAEGTVERSEVGRLIKIPRNPLLRAPGR